ncbi:hypothetical protein L914_18281 [Phytophthora nicotianae]|uniref:ZSWIM1/3 RNaseH-like domain-containing protein n=1 Tax=Phytophthora nicotianae TaxID=4792 RepID=W2ME97_PHYNI|nr:hypothetical protein L914_18281 [Phytophthora nicotianae]
MNNSSSIVHAVYFHTACQKRLFKTSLDVASLEVVLVDTTHGTNKTYHNLFSILVDDDFGKVGPVVQIWFGHQARQNLAIMVFSTKLKGQNVQHSLGESKTKENLVFYLEELKDKNPATEDIRGVVTGKDFKDRDMLIDALPQAREMLCQFHVIDYLRTQVSCCFYY